MADSEPIIIHGTSKGITITHGAGVLKIKPTDDPFGRVVVSRKDETDATKLRTFSLNEDWDITIESASPSATASRTRRSRKARTTRR
jgi:hypothetical protein